MCRCDGCMWNGMEFFLQAVQGRPASQWITAMPSAAATAHSKQLEVPCAPRMWHNTLLLAGLLVSAPVAVDRGQWRYIVLVAVHRVDPTESGWPTPCSPVVWCYGPVSPIHAV
jgi:hypothetical protein